MDQKGLLLCADTNWGLKRRVWHDELGGGGRGGKPDWVGGDDEDKEEDEVDFQVDGHLPR